MTALPNFNRFPGPGDLPGDNRNPNSPDYIEPAYGEDEAECDVAAALIEADEVAELVCDVRAVLGWIGNVDMTTVPPMYRAKVNQLWQQARKLDRMVDARMEANSTTGFGPEPSDIFMDAISRITGYRGEP